MNYDPDKLQFKNKHCRACYQKNTEKHGYFNMQCDGIAVDYDVKFAISKGMSEHDARWIYDPIYFFTKVYGSKPRWYQEPILLCTSRRLVSRQCRQSGKTLAIAMKILHFVATNANKEVLIFTPNEAQIKKIYEDYLLRDGIYKSDLLKSSVVSKSQKPFYQIKFDNSSYIKLMIASDASRGSTGDWIYVDESALIGSELLNSILLTIASKGKDAVQIQTSTPRGRGNQFYRACKEYDNWNEYHVSIHQIEEMRPLIADFKLQLGGKGFQQEAEAEFPDISGGPFNYKGIELAQEQNAYSTHSITGGKIYVGGVDWNGPVVGSYFYILEFDPVNYTYRLIDKEVVASTNWNSILAKNTLIKLNRKYNCKHWMVDFGYSQSLVEELRAYSMKISATVPPTHPDAQIKFTLETVEFGSFIEVVDPFTKEKLRKTTKSFITMQVARLFEPHNGYVPIKYSASDKELTECLQNYELLNTTARGIEQYGFPKGSGIEDHALDAACLAIYGIIKHYGDLFKRTIYQSVLLSSNNMTKIQAQEELSKIEENRSVLLVSDNDLSAIENDNGKIQPLKEEPKQVYIPRTFSRFGLTSDPLAPRRYSSRLSANSKVINRTAGL